MGGNAGGHFAHLGGALLGYLYARQLLNGKDIGEGFSRIVDAIANLFKKREKKAPMKTVYRKKRWRYRNNKAQYDKEGKPKRKLMLFWIKSANLVMKAYPKRKRIFCSKPVRRISIYEEILLF